MADNGGVRLAYYAYKLLSNSNEDNGQLLPGFGNFTSDQLFFISFAHVTIIIYIIQTKFFHNIVSNCRANVKQVFHTVHNLHQSLLCACS